MAFYDMNDSRANTSITEVAIVKARNCYVYGRIRNHR